MSLDAHRLLRNGSMCLVDTVYLQLTVMRRWESGSTPGIVSGDCPRISRKLKIDHFQVSAWDVDDLAKGRQRQRQRQRPGDDLEWVAEEEDEDDGEGDSCQPHLEIWKYLHCKSFERKVNIFIVNHIANLSHHLKVRATSLLRSCSSELRRPTCRTWNQS